MEYSEGILSILFKIIEPKKELALSMLSTTHTFVLILSEAYFLLTREKAIPTLEELPEDKKKELWQSSAGMRDRVKFCRSVHVLENI